MYSDDLTVPHADLDHRLPELDVLPAQRSINRQTGSRRPDLPTIQEAPETPRIMSPPVFPVDPHHFTNGYESDSSNSSFVFLSSPSSEEDQGN